MKRFDPETRSYLLSAIREMIYNERWEKFQEVVNQRTRYLTMVIEDFYQPHNGSAIIRTCELMGIQDLHVIENRNPYEINKDIVVGSDKWIDIYRYNSAEKNTIDCFKKLRKKGYRIVATSPHKDDCMLKDLPLDKKTALVFGNEGHGLSSDALNNADAYVRIPSVGFTESYNVSVSAALCLYEIREKLHQDNRPWQLSDEEKEILLLDYALKSVRNPKILVTNLLQIRQNKM
ncbi:MAG: TrmH family RNA methyltransferase [Bacteroidetes bacterium]|nr:MAG: TrmH family RNA methyltransferase [Bacteroidota bacterium]